VGVFRGRCFGDDVSGMDILGMDIAPSSDYRRSFMFFVIGNISTLVRRLEVQYHDGMNE
jgi:hypothetical protein